MGGEGSSFDAFDEKIQWFTNLEPTPGKQHLEPENENRELNENFYKTQEKLSEIYDDLGPRIMAKNLPNYPPPCASTPFVT